MTFLMSLGAAVIIACFLSPTSVVYGIAAAIVFILVGGVLPYLERKKLSLMQRRVGPKFTGLNGRLQFIADAVKLFLKHYYSLAFVKKTQFLLMPIFTLFFNLFLIINYTWFGNSFFSDIESNIIFFILLALISSILNFLSGYVCKNKYTVIASSRSISVFFINELFFTTIVLGFVYISRSFSFSSYIQMSSKYFGLMFWTTLLPMLIFLFMLEVNRVPFDFLEAESELISGITNEYVGFLFGVYVLIEYVHIFNFIFFLNVLIS